MTLVRPTKSFLKPIFASSYGEYIHIQIGTAHSCTHTHTHKNSQYNEALAQCHIGCKGASYAYTYDMNEMLLCICILNGSYIHTFMYE